MQPSKLSCSAQVSNCCRQCTLIVVYCVHVFGTCMTPCLAKQLGTSEQTRMSWRKIHPQVYAYVRIHGHIGFVSTAHSAGECGQSAPLPRRRPHTRDGANEYTLSIAGLRTSGKATGHECAAAGHHNDAESVGWKRDSDAR